MLRPSTVGEAVEMLSAARAAGLEAALLGGGTDLVPALRAGQRQVQTIIGLRRVLELRVRGAGADRLTIGAGVTYTDLVGWSLSPGLARAARVVGSAQIRNTGTVGGALGSARPASDLLTFLTAADAEVLTVSPRGPRRQPLARFLAARPEPDALVTAVRLARPGGPATYLKIGGRQAAYPAEVSCAVVVDRVRHTLACAVGGIGRQPVRMVEAEAYAQAAVDWATGTVSSAAAARFADLVTEATQALTPTLPVGPHGSARYRIHAAGVLAGRAFARCLNPAIARPALAATLLPAAPHSDFLRPDTFGPDTPHADPATPHVDGTGPQGAR
ncbi:xanthine dehydrogenase family protein subunit M [Frankia sp. AiPa1]|uniref:FAD binding domain-containing protein n=1 Tax=Frankia sp. AiPa1 TaxID=573492 RepID=UPI00202B5A3C|nr:FAD binding domain-containing protein [Frankia sp. AiPa1]MCL9762458.1 FAD binding domain-containing protein [Frankia sp. AiPa1]